MQLVCNKTRILTSEIQTLKEVLGDHFVALFIHFNDGFANGYMYVETVLLVLDED